MAEPKIVVWFAQVNEFKIRSFDVPEMREDGREPTVSENCPILKRSKQYPGLACDVLYLTFLREILKGSDPIRLIWA